MSLCKSKSPYCVNPYDTRLARRTISVAAQAAITHTTPVTDNPTARGIFTPPSLPETVAEVEFDIDCEDAITSVLEVGVLSVIFDMFVENVVASVESDTSDVGLKVAVDEKDDGDDDDDINDVDWTPIPVEGLAVILSSVLTFIVGLIDVSVDSVASVDEVLYLVDSVFDTVCNIVGVSLVADS